MFYLRSAHNKHRIRINHRKSLLFVLNVIILTLKYKQDVIFKGTHNILFRQIMLAAHCPKFLKILH